MKGQSVPDTCCDDHVQGGTLYQKTVLHNGIRVVTEKMAGVKSVSTGIWVSVGSRDEEGEERGISHFIEHMLFKGTQRRSAFDIARSWMPWAALPMPSPQRACLLSCQGVGLSPALGGRCSGGYFLNSVFAPEEIERGSRSFCRKST